MTRDRHPPTLSNFKQLKEQLTMITSYSFLSAWVRAHMSERGASLVEYALLVALIAVVCIVAITNLGTAASEKFSTVGASIDG
jgi:pilus assembly protein Flp/PilA